MGYIGRENGHPGLEGGWRDVVPFTQLLAKNEASKYMATVFTKPEKRSYTQLYSLTGDFFGNVCALLTFLNVLKMNSHLRKHITQMPILKNINLREILRVLENLGYV